MGCEVLSSLVVTISPAFHCHSKKCTHGREEPLLTCVNMDIVAQIHKRFAERIMCTVWLTVCSERKADSSAGKKEANTNILLLWRPHIVAPILLVFFKLLCWFKWSYLFKNIAGPDLLLHTDYGIWGFIEKLQFSIRPQVNMLQPTPTTVYFKSHSFILIIT